MRGDQLHNKKTNLPFMKITHGFFVKTMYIGDGVENWSDWEQKETGRGCQRDMSCWSDGAAHRWAFLFGAHFCESKWNWIWKIRRYSATRYSRGYNMKQFINDTDKNQSDEVEITDYYSKKYEKPLNTVSIKRQPFKAIKIILQKFKRTQSN